MVKEVEEGKIYNFKVATNSLSFLTGVIKNYNVFLIDELDIDPFNTFSLEFIGEYWYLKYYLLKDKKVLLTYDENYILFEEENLNIVFFRITDFENFLIECNDGNWHLKIYKVNTTTKEVFNIMKENSLLEVPKSRP